MIPQVLPPDVGSGLKASWGASVASAINQLANGLETRAKPLENQRNRRGLSGGGGDSTLRAFDIEGGKVVRCFAHAPIKEYSCADYTINGQGSIYAHLTRSSSSYTLSVNQTNSGETATHVAFLLWRWDANLETWIDHRPSVFPVFAL